MSEEQSQFEQYLSTKTSDLLDELSTLLTQYDNGKEMPIDVKVHLVMFNLGLRLINDDEYDEEEELDHKCLGELDLDDHNRR